MKVKTSITLSEELIKEINKLIGKSENKSYFIEKAIWFFLTQKIKQIQDNKDLQILNHNAQKLNKEAEDVLSYQIKI